MSCEKWFGLFSASLLLPHLVHNSLVRSAEWAVGVTLPPSEVAEFRNTKSLAISSDGGERAIPDQKGGVFTGLPDTLLESVVITSQDHILKWKIGHPSASALRPCTMDCGSGDEEGRFAFTIPLP